MNYYLIAIGGSVMHNLAIALKRDGHQVRGSDDEIYNPSRGRLAAEGLLPSEMGWNVGRITKDIDVVILGMHAKPDNPELKRAQELGLKVMSYPEFIFDRSKDKIRVVIAGSHGKTTTTSMILHVLLKLKKSFDYLVGAQLEGFDQMVKLSDAPVIVCEGDEYLSSPIDRRPKMLHYHPDIAVITGIAWDHINVFESFESYLQAFRDFINGLRGDYHLIYYAGDVHIPKMLDPSEEGHYVPYKALEIDVSKYNVFGKHNLENMSAAMQVCMKLGISRDQFLDAIRDFKGASKRLERIETESNIVAFRDFAHAPSKLQATISAVRDSYPKKRIIALFELHTYSSLNIKFLPEYKGSMEKADKVFLLYNEHTLKMKRLPQISKEDVARGFDVDESYVYTDPIKMKADFDAIIKDDDVVLLMSSGHFGGQKFI